MCEYRGGKPPCAMKVTVVGPSGALSAGHNPSGERSECEHTCWDPKGEKERERERCLDANYVVNLVIYCTLFLLH